MHVEPVAIIHTPFKEKFGIPRQPGLVTAAGGRIELLEPYNRPEALNGLDKFSHIWLIWEFHAVPEGEWKAVVRPPRLGGNRKVGVFASRSPFRPNPLGLSVVRLESVQGSELIVSGVDLLDQTPIYDIKPYISYTDAIQNSVDGFVTGAPEKKMTVEFIQAVQEQLDRHQHGEQLKALIIGCVELDPRPAYRKNDSGQFAFRLMDVDVEWRIEDTTAIITRLNPA